LGITKEAATPTNLGLDPTKDSATIHKKKIEKKVSQQTIIHLGRSAFNTVKMPKSLNKVTKHINKKKGPRAATLHANSRDQKMLIRASARDDRVQKLTSLREKMNTSHSMHMFFVELLAILMAY
jgi:hypothetical protein